jgi:hypothetical protein
MADRTTTDTVLLTVVNGDAAALHDGNSTTKEIRKKEREKEREEEREREIEREREREREMPH